MKKILAAYFLALLFACSPALAFIKHGGIAPVNPSIPTLVAGTAAPTAQTPTMPSASTWDPSCLDATWGACNLTTHTCIAPTSGTPLESCQPPQELVVTGGSGNGTNATITYTSYAHYTYPAASPLIVSSATQTNWNTPAIGVVSFASTAGPNTVTLGCQTSGNPPGFGNTCANLVAGQKIYVGNVSGNAPSAPGGGNWGGGFGWTNLQSITGSVTPPVAGNYTNVPVTGGSGTGGQLNINVNSSGVLTSVVFSSGGLGVGYVTGDVISVNTTGFTGLAGLTGFSATVVLTTPNGLWTVQSSASGSVTYNTGSFQVQGGLGGLNSLGYNGTIQEPFVVTSSVCNIGGVPERCSVTFPNTFTCTSSCVSATTHIVAGQFDDVIATWHYGEDMQNSVQNGDVQSCVLANHISPVQSVSESLDNGPWVTVTTPITDPWGPGKSTLSTAAYKVYCFHFAASSVADGLHEIRAISRPTVGYDSILSSVRAIDGNTGSTYFTANNHGLGSFKQFGITKSFDAGFPNYNWQSYTTGITATSGTGAGSGSFTLGFTQPANFPNFQANQVVGVTGMVTANSCPITAAFADGANLHLTYSGGCNFPTGSSVNIAGVTTGTTAISSWAYNSTTGIISVTFASAPNGTAPATGVNANNYVNQYWLTLTGTGTGLASLQGQHQLISTSGSGTVFNFQDSTGLSILTTTGGAVAGTGGSATGPLTWNTSANAGATVASGGTSTITVPSMLTSVWASGGTITANWNGSCAIASASSGSITCPTLDAATTRASGGTIVSQAGLYCNIGGSGDWQPPYSPASIGQQLSQMNPGSFQVEPYTGANCLGVQNATGCSVSPCENAVTPSQAETLWITRKDAGVDEHKAGGGPPLNANGSLFITTNAGGAIQGQDAHVDAWAATAGGIGCLGPAHAAGTLVAFTGTYCNDTRHAIQALVPTANGSNQTLATAGGCLTFTNANNAGSAVPFYTGEPVEFVGYDTNSSPALANWSVFWIQSLVGDAITIAATPTGACINETPANIIGGSGAGTAGIAELFKDEGMDNLLLACDTSAPTPCSNANPETYVDQASTTGLGSPTIYAKSGWLGILPDIAAGSTFPATSHQISFVNGIGGWFGAGPSQGGRIRVGVDTIQTPLSLTGAVSLTKTPAIQAVLSGTASGTIETLNFATLPSGVSWQVVDGHGSPGQGIVVSGLAPAACSITGVSGNGTTTTVSYSGSCAFGTGFSATVSGTSSALVNGIFVPTAASAGSVSYASAFSGALGAVGAIQDASWNCGTSSVPCHVTTASTTSITFTNLAPNPTYAGAFTAASKIIPATIVIEVAPGTLAYDATLNPGGWCASPTTNVSINTGSALACIAQNGSVAGTNSSAWPLYINSVYFTSIILSESCLLINSVQQPGVNGNTEILDTIPGAISGGNDIIEITSTLVAAGATSFQAFNDCNTGPFVFGNQPLILRGNGSQTGTDSWSDNRDISGPIWNSSKNGVDSDIGVFNGGASYQTNGHYYDVSAGADQATYAWGINVEYNQGQCANQMVVGIDIRCVGGEMAVPISLGGGNIDNVRNGAFWQPVLGGLDASGAATMCSGVPCINSLTKTVQVAQGTLPGTLNPGWIAAFVCNFSSPLNASSVGLSQNIGVSVFDNRTNPSTVTFATTGTGANCPITSNPTMVLYNIIHVDMMFFEVSENAPPMISYLPWSYFTDTVYENVQCPGCVDMQGIFYQGSTYFDQDFENNDIEIMGHPVPGADFSIQAYGPAGSYGFRNQIIRNTNLWGSVRIPSDASALQYDDVFLINDSGGANYIGYPNQAQFNVLYGGWTGGSNMQANPFGDTQNMTVWPSLTRGVDAGGVPIIPGTPGSGNLSACPWYCAPTDTGLGNM